MTIPIVIMAVIIIHPLTSKKAKGQFFSFLCAMRWVCFKKRRLKINPKKNTKTAVASSILYIQYCVVPSQQPIPMRKMLAPAMSHTRPAVRRSVFRDTPNVIVVWEICCKLNIKIGDILIDLIILRGLLITLKMRKRILKFIERENKYRYLLHRKSMESSSGLPYAISFQDTGKYISFVVCQN